MYQDFGRRLERDINKFVTARLDATRQITGQEVNVQNLRNVQINFKSNFSQSPSTFK